MRTQRSGPLSGVRVLEFAAQGPAPFCGMLLSDMGADVVRVDRKGSAPDPDGRILERGRRSVALDLKSEADRAQALDLIERADVLIEGYRPGVMERLGLGPHEALQRRPELVYGRMTGWGQSGPYAQMSGHDLNYVALSGALFMIGTGERPVSPFSLVGDYGGGGAFLTIGVIAALFHARSTGQGQVVDAAIIDGISVLMAANYGRLVSGALSEEREGRNIPWSNIYKCADGEFVTFQAYESKFYRVMLEKLGLDEDPLLTEQHNPELWPRQRARIAAVVEQKSRQAWSEIFEGSDACFAPVLRMSEAQQHPQLRSRDTFVDSFGILQPAPAPRFTATPSEIAGPQRTPGADQEAVFADWNVSPAPQARASLRKS